MGVKKNERTNHNLGAGFGEKAPSQEVIEKTCEVLKKKHTFIAG